MQREKDRKVEVYAKNTLIMDQDEPHNLNLPWRDTDKVIESMNWSYWLGVKKNLRNEEKVTWNYSW